MKTSKLLLLATLICLAIPAAAQLNDTYVIAAAANLQGGNNTRWLTQFSLFNPHLDYPLTISIVYLPTAQSTPIEKLIDLPPNAVFISDDVIGDVFNRFGGGALLIATFAEDNPGVPNNVISRSFLVTSNTYNNSPNGTYGQTIPGIWTGLLDYDYDGISSVAHGIDNSTRLKFRTNVGAVNLGRCSVTVRVSVYDADGRTLLRDAPFRIPPLSHLQSLLVDSSGRSLQVEGGSVEFLVEDPCWDDDALYAVVFPYTSTIDNLSGDPRYQSPTLLASASVLYGKKAIDPTQIGAKINSSYAMKVRERAESLGHALLRWTPRGWSVAE